MQMDGAEKATYGIGEWYGRSFVALTPAERRALADLQTTHGGAVPPCPFRSTTQDEAPCTKRGGVCSIRRYVADASETTVQVAPGDCGALCTTCPQRFQEGGLIFRWIGEEILGVASPIALGEIGFLERAELHSSAGDETLRREDVGRIDDVLVSPDTEHLSWCALEIQAVYFSGANMGTEFSALRQHVGDGLPFPVGRRRPDYRSSGPKRLMPQLQIKVPTLRRWGRKMAVVVDEGFFSAMGEMTRVPHISNGDIVWFVVSYDESAGEAHLTKSDMHVTTLESSVEGLTAGHPVSLPTFEARIREKVTEALRVAG